ncbi:peptidoglycan DD-metalloendopeptidase family protein [Bacteroidales bacterium OttesenSCG-928-E04]|nr:peptidoglycan DD-metalloendopeptidase family protein [Bacteroidales bacterium OttesenSCG-928-E04]
MKKTLILLFISMLSVTHAQVTVSDIHEHSQFNTAAKEELVFPEQEGIDFSRERFVSSNHQIPSYGLYDQEWSNNLLKSKDLDIPFSNGKLMVILVSENNNPFIFPCRGQLSRNYGVQRRKEFHPGIDFALQPDDQIYGCFDGVVRMATEFGDYGKVVVIRHYNGLETVYARLNKIYVKPGQVVAAGGVIGTAGNEGGKGILHFETRFMNEYFNPEIMLNVEERTLYSNNLFLKEDDFHVTKIPMVQPVKEEETKPEVPATTVAPERPKELQPEEKIDPQPQQTIRYHTVKKGETLYRISAKYNVPVETLIKINKLPANGAIREGQKLLVN